MKEWETSTIGEACHVVNGGTPKTKVDEYWGGCHPWITPAEMGKLPSPYLGTTRRTLTDAGLDASSASLLQEQSVIISSRAPIGHLIINTVPMATNQGCKGLTPKAALSTKFLFFFLYHKVDYLNSLGTGATFKELSATKLKTVPIPLPPLPEQERIVAILDEAFAAIATATANAEKNLANARELFEQSLNVVFAARGDEWIRDSFGGLVTRSRGGISIKSSEYGPTGVPVLTKGDVKPWGRIVPGGKYVDTNHVTEQGWPLTQPNDLIVATRDLKPSGPFLGMVARVPANQRYLVNQGATFFGIDQNRISIDYFVYWCCSSDYRRHIRAHKSGATQVHIRQADLFGAPIWFPPLRQQDAIVEKLDEIAIRVGTYNQQHDRRIKLCAALKQSLLHKAFTGELTADKNAADRTLSEAGV